MLISISVTYDDINSTVPRLAMRRRKRLLKVRRKRRPPTDVIKRLKRQLSNVRSKIRRRLDDVKFRMGDPKKLAQKRQEANKMKVEHDRLVRRIETLEKGRQRAAEVRGSK